GRVPDVLQRHAFHDDPVQVQLRQVQPADRVARRWSGSRRGTRRSRRDQGRVVPGVVELGTEVVLVVGDGGRLAVHLVGGEQQDDQAQRDEQLAADPGGAAQEAAHQSGACAYCNAVGPSYAGTVTSVSVLTWYPRPSVPAAN